MEIKYRNVTFSYNKGTENETKVLKKVNLDVSEGISLVIGKSGSGKTTMIEMINALLIPTGGELTVGKFEIAFDKKIEKVNDLRKNIGFVFQFPEDQIFEKTVLKEIKFGLKYLKIKKTKEEVIKILEKVGLNESYLKRNPLLLSNGEKRRVAIASILITDPEILIFDEPSVGLDNEGIKALTKIIREFKRENKKIIIISHDVDLWYEYADNIIGVSNGKVIINSSKKETYNNIDIMKEHDIFIPKVVEFLDVLKEEHNIDLGFHDNIHDLMKAVYRHVK